MKLGNQSLILLAGVVLAVVGAFLAFTDITGGGTVWDSDSGKVVVVLAVIGAVLHLMKRHVEAAVALMVASGILLGHVYDVFTTDGVGLGIGGWLILVGGLVAIYGAAMHISAKK